MTAGSAKTRYFLLFLDLNPLSPAVRHQLQLTVSANPEQYKQHIAQRLCTRASQIPFEGVGIVVKVLSLVLFRWIF